MGVFLCVSSTPMRRQVIVYVACHRRPAYSNVFFTPRCLSLACFLLKGGLGICGIGAVEPTFVSSFRFRPRGSPDVHLPRPSGLWIRADSPADDLRRGNFCSNLEASGAYIETLCAISSRGVTENVGGCVFSLSARPGVARRGPDTPYVRTDFVRSSGLSLTEPTS